MPKGIPKKGFRVVKSKATLAKEAKRRAGKSAPQVKPLKVTTYGKSVKAMTYSPTIDKTGSSRLELLVKSVVEQCATDPTFPAITLSYKTNSNEYYASITRYSNTYGREPKSHINACGDTLAEALEKLFEMWLNRIAPTQNATAALRQSREKGEI